MKNKRLLSIKEDLYAKAFLCGVPIYINSCFVNSDECDDNDESYHFEIVIAPSCFPCLEFQNYLYDFADDLNIDSTKGLARINAVFS